MARNNVRPAIEVRHGGDLDAVRAEITATTQIDLMERYEIATKTLANWEQMYGAKCMRHCRRHQGYVLHADMAKDVTGRAKRLCQACAPKAARKPTKSKTTREFVAAEFGATPQAFYELTRQPMSRSGGPPRSYWAQAGLYMTGELEQLEGV